MIEIQTVTGPKSINPDELFIIAEVGNQFNGNLETAKKLALAAKEAGADAVKYIFWFPDEIMADKSQSYSYEVQRLRYTEQMGELVTKETISEPMYDLLSRLTLSYRDWESVKMYCDKIGIIMIATVNSPTSFEWAVDLGLPALKLSSWDWNFTDLWKWCAKTMLPVFADMGPVTPEEYARNIKIFTEERNKNLIILHCFHTKDYIQMNMGNVKNGYSAADDNDSLDILAIGRGAFVLEKRLTLDRKAGVLHDAVSKEPAEFKAYVTLMRQLKTAMGRSITPSDEDMRQRKLWFRRIVADCNIAKGDTILRHMLEAKRGETGISPEFMDDFTGKVAKEDIKRNDDIKYTYS